MGFDQLLDFWLTVKYQQPVRRDVCPICGYPLEETDRGLHCQFDGWSELSPPPKFIPRVPEDSK